VPYTDLREWIRQLDKAGELRRIGEADNREPRQPRSHVDLDPDQPAIEAMERRGRDDGQHTRTLGGGPHLPVKRASSVAYPALDQDQRSATAVVAETTGLSTVRANCRTDPPRAESALPNMNGAPFIFREAEAPIKGIHAGNTVRAAFLSERLPIIMIIC